MPQFSPEGMDKNKEMIGYLTEMADRKNATPAQISLAWMLDTVPMSEVFGGSRISDKK